MGYYSYYHLTHDFHDDTEIRKVLIQINDGWFADPKDAINQLMDDEVETQSWDWVNDMHDLSIRYPDTVFTLHGRGENPSDRWKEYFKNGKSHTAKAVVIFEAFDEKKLA